ncbi:hypothetical protein ABZY36_06845 [Streptomyces sp. NPDC006627]|uniref:hypothetical protein n=1 Tax=Streptomyces sp. NPDC006627 TaxID=3154679 RepID=UPI0033B82B6A
MPRLPPVHGLVDPEEAHIYPQAVDHAGITAAPLHLLNVTFEQGDAQVHPFPRAGSTS